MVIPPSTAEGDSMETLTDEEKQALIDEMERLRRLVAQLLIGAPSTDALACAARLVKRLEAIDKKLGIHTRVNA